MGIFKKILEVVIKIFFDILFFFFGRPRLSKYLKKATVLYKGGGFSEAFSEVRAWDAPYGMLERLVPKRGYILDLGCGDGLLANYLALGSKNRKVVGIELNRDRLVLADKGLKNTEFRQGDILKVFFPSTNVVILAHVLHHLPGRFEQETLLASIAKNLKKKGKLIILEIDRKPLAKYLFSWFTDALIVPILFEGKLFSSQFYYRRRSEWKSLLEGLGFKVNIKSAHKDMPFSHVLIEAIKR